MTHIRCSWTEVPGLPLSLYHLDADEHRVSACVPGPPGQKRLRCQYNTSLFAIGFDDVFFFYTPHVQGLSGTFHLTQHGNITEDWTHVRLASKPSSPAMTQSMTFNLGPSHRILVELREDNRNSLTTAQKRRIDNDISSTSALPGPINLQCVYDGEYEVKCKWQMMRELAQYVVFDLAYRTQLNATSELCCAGLDNNDDDDDDAMVRFSCSFSVPEVKTLLLSLHPQPRTKVFQSHKHIEPAAPVAIGVELIGDDWVLNWTLPKYRTVPITSEFRYWSTTSPEELAETLSLPPGVSVCVMAEGSLRSSTRYLAQVRCSVSSRRGRGSRYAGYPSDWSKPVYWTTRPVASAWVYFLLSASVSVALITIYFILLAFHRRLKVWDVSLPSPFQSKLMDTVCQVHAEGLFPCAEMDDPCLSRVCVLENLQLNLHTVDDVTPLHAAHCTGPNHYTSQEGSAVPGFTTQMWHCASFPEHSSEHAGFDTLLCDGRFACLSSASYHNLQPCSEGYQRNPASSPDASSTDV
ncbi:uncharacterized protein LOC132874796 [Neoarius graeffei]|uniref:uncharacterized protein LOC132874796 n=1 Tax=Neoarius graeffei TaxID=443677 RepID=UPI00298C2DCB|nr:uncharacterized protein LOC132874796 [Neoarius graeffei]